MRMISEGGGAVYHDMIIVFKRFSLVTLRKVEIRKPDIKLLLESRLKMMMCCSRMIAERDRKRGGGERNGFF